MTEHTPYRPSNGSEGEYFESKFCLQCARVDEDPHGGCPIWGAAIEFGADDPNYPKELRLDERGRPTCTGFQCADGEGGTPVMNYRCDETPDMFRVKKE